MMRSLSRSAFGLNPRLFKAFAACATVLGSLLAALPATAQTPERIANIETATNASVCELTPLGNKVIYAAITTSASSGCRLFATDSQLTSPTALGPDQRVRALRRIGGRVVFFACQANFSFCDVWSTDGTSTGTTQLATGAFNPDSYNIWGGFRDVPLWFSAQVNGSARWYVTDGTQAGTRDAGPLTSSFSSYRATANGLYWAESNGVQWQIRRLLASGGGPETFATYPANEYSIIVSGASRTQAYFHVLRYTAPSRTDLVAVSDSGTASSTLLTTTGAFSSEPMRRVDNTVVFRWCASVSGGGPVCARYRSDGTSAGTVSAPELAPVVESEMYELEKGIVAAFDPGTGIRSLVNISDTSVSPLLGGSRYTTTSTNRNAFAVCVPDGQSVETGTWIGDGTPSGMRKLTGECVNLSALSATFGSSVIEPRQSGVTSTLAKTEYPIGTRTLLRGTPSGSAQFGDVALRPDGMGLFTACDSERNCGLWKTDGTSAGTALLKSFPLSDPQLGPAMYGNVGANTYFFAQGNSTTQGAAGTVLLGVTDGTVAGSRVLASFPTVNLVGLAFFGQRSIFHQMGAKIYFAACFENTPNRCGLWSTDGTEQGTSVVAPIASTNVPTFASLDVVGGRLVFEWCEPGFGCQLFGSDGTVAGTVSLASLESSVLRTGTTYGGRYYFSTCNGGNGACTLRQTDGTVVGTTDATPLFPRTDLRIVSLKSFGDKMLLATSLPNSSSSLQLWVLQTGVAASVVAGALAGPPGEVVEVAGRAFFYTNRSGFSAPELWVTDGTAIGTKLVATTYVDTRDTAGFGPRPVVVGTSVAFQQCRPDADCEIWRTNTTGGSPTRIARLKAESSQFSSDPLERSTPYLAFGNRLVFLGDDGKEGLELWAIDVPQSISGDADEDGIPDAIDNTANGTNPGVKDNNIFSNARLFAMQQARDFLGREATASEITSMVNAIASGTTRSALIEQMLNTPEHFDLYGPIIRLYQAYFLRPSDIGGLNFWVTQYKNRPASGWSFEGISEFFSLSQEFKDRYGALNNNQFVTLIYNNVLNRAPDAGGLTFWVDELDKGRRIRGNVMAGFSESPENKGKTKGEVQVATLYGVMLKKDIDPAVYAEWVPRINAGQSIRPLIDQLFAKPEYRARFLP